MGRSLGVLGFERYHGVGNARAFFNETMNYLFMESLPITRPTMI